MPIEITMPRLSDTMQQGTVVKWNVKEGDTVKSGDVLADIETDKATMELESFDAGVVASLAAKEGANVPVGATIVVLATKGEDPAEVKAKAGGGAATSSGKKDEAKAPAAKAEGGKDAGANGRAAAAVAEPEVEEEPEQTPSNGAAAPRGGRIFASPLAKKVADDLGVDLSGVEGSGPSGRIVRADVEAAASGGARKKAPTQPKQTTGTGRAPVTTIPGAPVFAGEGEGLSAKSIALSNMRRTIARRLVESKTSIPHYQVTVVVDMDPLMALRQTLNEQLGSQGVKLSVNDFLVRACAIAMHQHPLINSSWSESGNESGDEPGIRLHERVNIGVAIALPVDVPAGKYGGLVVATIRDADRVGLRTISSQTKAYSEKARAKGLSIEDQSDSTFTISNLGMFGVEHFTAIINPPNTAILAVGGATKKPVVRTVNGVDQIVVGHEMQMTMSSDHRVIDGAMAAQYLSTVREILEHPATMLV